VQLINDPPTACKSHEFRSPLNAIIGFTGTLLMRLPGPLNVDQEKQLRIIEESANKLLSLVEAMPDSPGIAAEVATQLPLSATPRRKQESAGSPIPSKAKVLLIEDDPVSRKLMVYLLNSFGHEAIVAIDGEQGLEKARQEKPDLILCDMQLPKCNGLEVARTLKSDPSLSHIPIVALTASAPSAHADKTHGDDFDFHLRKPIRSEALSEQLEALIAANAVRRLVRSQSPALNRSGSD
jgi:two-component system cell cycle response regulator DivK